MKQLATRFIIFNLTLGIVLWIISLGYSTIQEGYFSNNALSIGKTNTTLILGDSHTQTGLNDSIIDHSVNVSFHGEHYLYTYYKLKKIIEQNPQINQVILGFGYHNLSELSDKRLFDTDKTSRSYSRYFMLLDKEGIMKAKNASLNWQVNFLKHQFHIPFQLKMESGLLKSTLTNTPISFSNFPFIGKFHNSNRNNFTTLEYEIHNHYYKKDKKTLLNTSALSFEYLMKICEYLDSNNIQLTLINTPLYSDYQNRIPEKFISHHEKCLKKLKNEHSNLVFYNFDRLIVNKNQFGDGHHLNAIGAKVLSLHLNKLLN